MVAHTFSLKWKVQVYVPTISDDWDLQVTPLELYQKRNGVLVEAKRNLSYRMLRIGIDET